MCGVIFAVGLFFQILTLIKYEFHPFKEHSFISVNTGENVTLSCKVEKSDTYVQFWYKQQLWQKPKEVVSKLDQKPPFILNGSKFSVNEDFSLTIKETSEDDEGMYFCGKTDGKTFTFSNIKVLAVTGNHITLNISVLQTPVRGLVSPGESVTLQCTITAADLRVLWFRAAAGQSFPEIIYTHQNSSSRQCEISSSTSSSLYEFSKNILDHIHTGTYYCAVAACGKIIFGNGTSVELSKSFCALLGACVADGKCFLGLELYFHVYVIKIKKNIKNTMCSVLKC
uniref:Ig-like domain-containing protein n=1 Tax=Pygocentrus nattereri TaxID=42514 RepID=A0A3B4CM30_PYGNA